MLSSALFSHTALNVSQHSPFFLTPMHAGGTWCCTLQPDFYGPFLHVWWETALWTAVFPSVLLFREFRSQGRTCACISQQAELDSRGWCRTGLRSIMISLSGSLNNAKVFNRTHSLMAEIDKNHFTHWQQTACLFIPQQKDRKDAEQGWNILDMLYLEMHCTGLVFYCMSSSMMPSKRLYPSFPWSQSHLAFLSQAFPQLPEAADLILKSKLYFSCVHTHFFTSDGWDLRRVR